jgi:membrane protein DedA with SNARE-associated domain
MTLTEFVTTYGYLAVLAGALLEGESILLLAGFAAHQGMLSLPLVLLIAFVGGTVGDQGFFWLGRRWGGRLLERYPVLRLRTARVATLLQRWDAALVFGVRFMYGLRIAGPIAMGALGVSRARFFCFNMLGAAVWAVLVGGAGYLMGETLQMILGEIEGYESAVLWGIAGSVALFFALKRVLRIVRVLRLRAALRAQARTQLPFD